MPRWWTLSDTLGHTVNVNQHDGNNRLTPDSNGVYWYAEDVDGWFSPAIRAKVEDKAGDVGQLAAAVEYSSRSVALRGGLCFAPSEALRYTSEQALATVLRLTDPLNPGSLVTHEDIDRTLFVVKAEAGTTLYLPPGPVAPYLTYAWPFRFDIPLLAPDPRKYGAAGTVTLPGTATNAGDFPTWPTLTVASGADGDSVTLAGQTVSITSANGAIPASLTINFATKTVTDGSGGDAYHVINSDTWFQLIPGANPITKTGTSTMTLAWSDAYI